MRENVLLNDNDMFAVNYFKVTRCAKGQRLYL